MKRETKREAYIEKKSDITSEKKRQTKSKRETERVDDLVKTENECIKYITLTLMICN